METMRLLVGLTNKARGYPGSSLVCVLANLLSTPGRVSNICPTYYANPENVPLTLDEAIFEVAREAISQKCIVAKALWTELRSAQTHMNLQHLFFDSKD